MVRASIGIAEYLDVHKSEDLSVSGTTKTTSTTSSTRRLTELHIIRARELALRLLAVANTRYPDVWAGSLIIDSVLIELCEFAFHARRVMDLCNFQKTDFQSADAMCFNNLGGLVFEKDLKKALNSFHHVNDLSIGWSEWLGTKIYIKSDKELILSYITVNGRSPATISLFGVAFEFLAKVVPAVKIKFPDYQF